MQNCRVATTTAATYRLGHPESKAPAATARRRKLFPVEPEVELSQAAASSPAHAQVRQVRALCTDLPHGPARDALLGAVESVAADLAAERLRVAVVAPGEASADRWARWMQGVVGSTPAADAALVIASPEPAAQSKRVATGSLAKIAREAGIGSACFIRDAATAFASPLLLGHLASRIDVLFLVGEAGDDPVVLQGLAALRATCGEPLAWDGEGTLPVHWAATIDADRRKALCATAALSRLTQAADLGRRLLADEVGEIRARMTDVARTRKVDDHSQGAEDLRAQAEIVKQALADWALSCKEELARAHEDGFLPFDARLLANKLTRDDLLEREEVWVAIHKYPILNARVVRPFVTHHYVVLPDPDALDGIRKRLLSALETQGMKDLERVNQRVGELEQQLRRNAALYPNLAEAVAQVKLPRMAPAELHRPLAAVSLEVEAEDKFTRVGIFKRLMEGRMVASMIFSFITMLAGVFVLFGDPSVKRTLMKLSGVVVIMMFGYFGFTLLVRKEEEEEERDACVERLRSQLAAATQQPLGRASAAIMKALVTAIELARERVMARLEVAARHLATERARLSEQRKVEDEMLKGFLARRQAAMTAFAQKATALISALEKMKGAPSAGTVAGAAPLARTALAAGIPEDKPAIAPPRPFTPPAAPVRRSASERFGASATAPVPSRDKATEDGA